ncbi:diguanylate cyclase (GGDEF)-like protein [Motilibacter rhizosphaerae]|uniref:Diguanylate cyclase (GGDEF)-like protein n=1 Tax=Motilibacter rhizosphaerae TaxID=598652 RepID=A0A4V2F4E5_9ACTN|nr:GGDEF domain-containing protein [Motilibacter rhizosphaerae]RZS87327.1 diguanylate cyclase (GGDEF)-like protein [Motilibacter rhizosphaerae]
MSSQQLDRTVAVPDEVLLSVLLDHTSDLLLVVAPPGEVVYASPSLLAQLADGDALVGRTALHLVHPTQRELAREVHYRCLQTGQPETVDLQLLLRTPSVELAYEPGRWFQVTMHPRPGLGLVVTGHDISARIAHAKELEHLAFHDRLTGLANRVRLERELDRPVRGRRAIMVLDLDGFARINERVGETGGDAVLRSTAWRLRRMIPAGGLCAYLGGDEFALLLTGIRSPAQAEVLAEQVVGALAEPVRVGDDVLTVTASAGLAIDVGDALHGDELLRRADSAMHLAKQQGRGRTVVFDSAAAARAAARAEVARRLAAAADEDELVLHYQPLLALASGRVHGAEALLRWDSSTGMVPPDEFIPVAEEAGLVHELGRWALRRACADLVALPGLTVSVNVSARQLHHDSFARSVEQALSSSGIAPERLVIELTESAVVEDPAAAQAVLGRLRRLGVGIALDDFGTGYSSLSYLLHLPVDTLKVDRSFVADIVTDRRTQLLVHGITTLAHDLGMSVTVEGVETEEQLEAIRQTGCDAVQGYLIGRPVPLAALSS